MSDITVRPAEASDIDALTTIWFEGWHDAHAAIVPGALGQIRTRENFRERLLSDLGSVRVFPASGAPLGFVMLRGDELYQFYVAAAARGTGVAAALMADAEAQLLAQGVRTAWLACAVGNARAARFYEKCGWQRVATVAVPANTSDRPFPLEEWRYEKTLRPHMTETPVAFDDGSAYDRYMGRWSRAIGERFLAWLNPPANLRWLDVGCGTGAFTQLVLGRAGPETIVGLDASAAQVEHARRTVTAPQVGFREGSAGDLPFETGAFDVVVSALAIHFFPDRPKAFGEMLRVTKPGGIMAGYTWRKSATIVDAPYGPLARAVRDVAGDVMISPAVPEAMPEGLRAALVAEGYGDIEITTVEAGQTFRDFEDYWMSQTATFPHPVAKSAAALSDEHRERLRGLLRTALPAAADGTITYSSRATAFKARKAR